MMPTEKKERILCLFEDAKADKELFRDKSYYRKEESVYLEYEDQVPLIRFFAFDPYRAFVNAAFSTRFGGVSEEYLSELNLGFDRGEPKENVEENYRRICKSMGEDYRKLVLSDQIHKTDIKLVTRRDCTGDVIEKSLQGIDGLVSNEEVVLATSYADCVPLLFADPVKKVIASSHSGWRGTVGKIGEKTVLEMTEQYGCKKEDIIAVIGPSICQKCYEVSEDVILEFEKIFTEEKLREIVEKTPFKPGKYQLDLWAANYYILKEAGISPEHIHVSAVCTCHHDKLLFSHRASKGKRGNLNAFIALHSSCRSTP